MSGLDLLKIVVSELERDYGRYAVYDSVDASVVREAERHRFRVWFDRNWFVRARKSYEAICAKKNIPPDVHSSSMDVLHGGIDMISKARDHGIRAKLMTYGGGSYHTLIATAKLAHQFMESPNRRKNNVKAIATLLKLLTLEADDSEWIQVLAKSGYDEYLPTSFRVETVDKRKATDQIDAMVYWLKWWLCDLGALEAIRTYLETVESLSGQLDKILAADMWDDTLHFQIKLLLANLAHFTDHQTHVVEDLLKIHALCESKIPKLLHVEERRCFRCGKLHNALQEVRCNVCHVASYCSKECKEKDLEKEGGHKQECIHFSTFSLDERRIVRRIRYDAAHACDPEHPRDQYGLTETEKTRLPADTDCSRPFVWTLLTLANETETNENPSANNGNANGSTLQINEILRPKRKRRIVAK